MSALTFGSLFSGIGGLDLGLERAGMVARWQSEIDPYASRVLAKHWPDVPNLGDVRSIDWSTVDRVDLICGGYPCQPFSLAGVRRGESDPRHLWPHFRDAIDVLRPRFALLENVPGHLSLGFGTVLGELAALGFDAEWDCIPAAAVGAPHLRYRVFVVAYARGDTVGHSGRRGSSEPQGSGLPAEFGDDGPQEPLADTRSERRVRQRLTQSSRFQGPRRGIADRRRQVRQLHDTQTATVAEPGRSRRAELQESEARRRISRGWERSRLRSARRRPGTSRRGGREGVGGWWSVESDLGGVVDELSPRMDGAWWDVEPDVGRVATGVPNRLDRLRCLGNAVVPAVAEWVGRRIVEAAS